MFATRPVQAGYQPKFNRIAGGFENNRNGRGRNLGSKSCWRTGCGDHAYAAAHQIDRHCRKSIFVTLSPMVFGRDVVAFAEAGFT
jgi:hypothetical protein